MKTVCKILLLIVIYSSFQVWAGPAEDRYLRMLTSGDMRELKLAAKEIKSRHLKDPEVMDVVAEVLLQLYGSASKPQIGPLSWAARALGSSRNGRYFAVLDEVSAGANHKKLRKHARKAKKELSESAGAKVEQYKKGMKKVSIVGY